MARKPHIEVYRDAEGKWRYRYKAANGRNTENPGQGYTRRYTATTRASKQHPGVEIRDEGGVVLRPAA